MNRLISVILWVVGIGAAIMLGADRHFNLFAAAGISGAIMAGAWFASRPAALSVIVREGGSVFTFILMQLVVHAVIGMFFAGITRLVT